MANSARETQAGLFIASQDSTLHVHFFFTATRPKGSYGLSLMSFLISKGLFALLSYLSLSLYHSDLFFMVLFGYNCCRESLTFFSYDFSRVDRGF